ncbi:MAG: phosphoribosyltransferase family protein [Bdellovibrionota bacterium]
MKSIHRLFSAMSKHPIVRSMAKAGSELLCVYHCILCQQLPSDKPYLGLCTLCWTQLFEPRTTLMTDPWMTIHSFGRYQSNLRRLILTSKMQNQSSSTRILSQLMTHRFDQMFEGQCFDVLIPIPRDYGRTVWRGIDVPGYLAHSLHRTQKIPLDPRGLKKKRRVPRQSSLSHAKRVQNTKDLFYCTQSYEGKNVLVLDDVMTTGSTLRHAALCLFQHGAKTVTAVTLASASRSKASKKRSALEA